MSMIDDVEDEFEKNTLATINKALSAADVAPWRWDWGFATGLLEIKSTIDSMMDARGYPPVPIPVDNHSSQLERAIKTIATCTCEHDCQKCHLLVMQHLDGGGYCARAIFSLVVPAQDKMPGTAQAAEPNKAENKQT